MSADEKVLYNNYDIPPSVFLHFLDGSTGMVDGPGNICVYECLFLQEFIFLSPLLSRSCIIYGDCLEEAIAQWLEIIFGHVPVVAFHVSGGDHVDP